MVKQNDKKNSKKKKALAAASGLALIALLSGTFAWINAQDQRVNRIESMAVSDGSVVVNETFTPTPIHPGGEATKEVSITNSGSSSVFVRASFEEVLKHLEKDGQEIARSAAWKLDDSTTAKKAGVGSDLPVIMNVKKYENWTDITSKVDNVPTGVTVKAKGSFTIDPVTNKEVQEFEYAMYSSLGKDNQKVNGKVTVNDKGTAPSEAKDWSYTLDVNSLEYYVYENGYNVNTANWAKSGLPNADGKSVTGAALLGTKGNRYGKDYDYRNQTAGGIIPDANLDLSVKLIAANYPTTANPTTSIQADNKNKISLAFNGAALLDPAGTLSADKWVYNPADGWFYYTSPIASGVTTPNMLEKIVYSSSIDKEYSNAVYDLVVKMEAVQGVSEALTDTQAGGFGLKTGDPILDILKDSVKK